MQVKLTEGEQARLRYTTTKNVEAWTYWVQGLSHYRGPATKENMGPARLYWEKALALDPTSAALNAMLGFMHCLDARFGWWDDRETALGKARTYTDKALELEPANADAYRTSSVVLLAQGRYDEAVVDAKRSVQLAPGSADVAELASFVLASSGFPEEAVILIEKAMALSPNYPPVYLGILGNAYRLSGRIEEAIAAFKVYDARHPGFGLTDLVIAYQENGQADEAKQTAQRLLAVRRNFTITSWLKTQFRRDTVRLDANIAALRVAGLPMGLSTLSLPKLARRVT
jgi:adenylate cyclase